MTPAERDALDLLSLRLFGAEGQTGALGRIEDKVDGLADRVTALETDRKVRDAIVRERASEAGERKLSRRERRALYVTTVAAVIGPAILIAAQVLGIVR